MPDLTLSPNQNYVKTKVSEVTNRKNLIQISFLIKSNNDYLRVKNKIRIKKYTKIKKSKKKNIKYCNFDLLEI